MPLYLVNDDGLVLNGLQDQPKQPKPEKVLERFTRALDKGVEKKGDLRKGVGLKLKSLNWEVDLAVFCTGELTDQGKGRRPGVDRMQLGNSWNDHAMEFQWDPNGKERCLVLAGCLPSGSKDDHMLFVGWLSLHHIDHGQISIYVGVEALSEAQRFGFAQWKDDKGHVVCVFRPEFARYYVRNLALLHNWTTEQGEKGGNPAEDAGVDTGAASPAPEQESDRPRNRILYGAPGTGKSHRLEQEAAELVDDERRRLRVTFHGEYSYAQFVGSYRPAPVYRQVNTPLLGPDKVSSAGSHEPLIDYRFVPGPFLEMLVAAHHEPEHNHLLLIEELNRASVASVFGEAFQMLDRDAAGRGRFSVAFPPEAHGFLSANGLDPQAVRLPANLHIWATLNSADQGVQPLDAAFKRRWSFEYMPLEKNAEVMNGAKVGLPRNGDIQQVEWNTFRRVINRRLRELGVTEDRLLGPFFLARHELDDPDAFKNKVLMYLFDDVVRHEAPGVLFRRSTFGELVEDFDSRMEIFVGDLPLFDDAP